MINRKIVSNCGARRLHKIENIPITNALFESTFSLPHFSTIFPPQILYITAPKPPKEKRRLIFDLLKSMISFAYRDMKGPLVVRLNKSKREERAATTNNIFLLNNFLKESFLFICIR